MESKLKFVAPLRRAARRRVRAVPVGANAAREHPRSAGMRSGMCARRWWRAVVERERQIRQRIACQLHDEVGQLLLLQSLKLGELRCLVGADAAVLVRELQALLDRTAAAALDAVLDLAEPAYSFQLVPALRELAARMSGHGFVTVTVEDLLPRLVLPERHVQVIRRIAQELCLNAQKHAQARQIRIRASIEDTLLCVSVCDDGTGLTRQLDGTRPDARGGLGLTSVQAQLRALGGRLQVHSRPGHGTCVSLLLPRPFEA